jgi:hypothetical protein
VSFWRERACTPARQEREEIVPRFTEGETRRLADRFADGHPEHRFGSVVPANDLTGAG